MKERQKRVTYSVDEEIIKENINNLNGGMQKYKRRFKFATRLNRLLEEKEINQEDFADMVNASTGVISKYRNGISEPDLTLLSNMAEKLGVSMDYLSGLSDFESPNIDSIGISKITGLSTKAIDVLEICKERYPDYLIPTINFLIEQENLTLLEELIEYKWADKSVNIENSKMSKAKKDEALNNLKKEYDKENKKLEAMNYKPILSIIDSYFTLKVKSDEEIYITDNSIKKEKDVITRKIVTSNKIVDSAYFEELLDQLKEAKQKYLESEVDS